MSKPDGLDIATSEILPSSDPENCSADDSKSSEPESWRLRRFYGRTLVAIFAPLAISLFYLGTFLLYLRRNKDDPVKFGLRNGTWIFYSWFATSVMGLGISRYGLLGIEAAMLQERTWQAKNAMAVLTHSGGTWSGPGGWMRALKRLFLGRERDVGFLWYFLAFLSLMPFIALPLSGFCMGLSDGYVELGANPMVIGRKLEDFNLRPYNDTVERGINIWENGFIPNIPGIGIAYTRPDVDRSQYGFLKTLPNTLPLDEGTPEIFLPQQANVPISGKVWGLLLSYNCSAVRSASEFRILSQRSSAVEPDDIGPGELELKIPTGGFIYLSNSSKTIHGKNLWAYTEMGLTDNLTVVQGYDGSESSFLSPDGRLTPDNATAMEYAIWQVRFADPNEEFIFNDTIDTPIDGMGGVLIQSPNNTFSRNKTFFPSPFQASFVGPSLEKSAESVADPVGVRCLRSSILGYAKVNARFSTFTSFEQTPNPHFGTNTRNRTRRFGETAAAIVSNTYLETFTSAGMPPPSTFSDAVYYRNFVRASTLLKSVLLAHAADALQIMFDGTYVFDGAFLINDATSSKPAKVLDVSVVDPWYPMPFLAVWAIGSAILGATYGFRRRWSDLLDGYCLFRFGADFASEIKDKVNFSSTRSFRECDALRKLPGLVGDSQKDMNVGHISLVEKDNIAVKERPYI